MNVILGASGRVGSEIVRRLREAGQMVKAVVRNEAKSGQLRENGVIVEVADYFDVDALKTAFHGANTAFLLTPENPESADFIEDTAMLLQNYFEAINSSNVKRIIGLSSFGAQHSSNTGNLEASYMLEQKFKELDVEQIFVRPTYYFSNWLGYLDLAKENGVLPTFFPPDLKIPMIAPEDVGTFIADLILGKGRTQSVLEIAGPDSYSSNDIAQIFGSLLKRNVDAVQIPRNQWQSTLEQAGFSPSGARNLALMTDATISGKTQAEGEVISLHTTFSDYLKKFI